MLKLNKYKNVKILDVAKLDYLKINKVVDVTYGYEIASLAIFGLEFVSGIFYPRIALFNIDNKQLDIYYLDDFLKKVKGKWQYKNKKIKKEVMEQRKMCKIWHKIVEDINNGDW